MKRRIFVDAAGVAALALLPTVGNPQGAPLRETVTIVANEPIPNVPGKRLISLIVDYPPGASSTPHRHARSAFIYAYVLSGEVRSRSLTNLSASTAPATGGPSVPALIIG
jgi:hypothetical protein